jgi:hypothetical protein
MIGKKILKIVLWCGLIAIFLYPFLGLLIHHWSGWSVGPLYTFGLELKDFMTVWIAFCGVVGVVANFFLTRRRMEEQQKQFDKQIGKQNEQIELQQKQQRDARFASGVELLGNPHESTRIGGVYNLYFLARDFKEYRTPVCEILCAHLRSIAHNSKFETDEQRTKYPRNEVQSLIDIFLWRIDISKTEKEFAPTLNKVKFFKATLTEVDFEGTLLERYSYEEITRIGRSLELTTPQE